MSEKMHDTRWDDELRGLYRSFSEELDKVALPSAEELASMLERRAGSGALGAESGERKAVSVVPLWANRRLWRYAAAVLILVGIGIAGWLVMGGKHETMTASNGMTGSDNTPGAPFRKDAGKLSANDSNAVILPNTTDEPALLAQSDGAVHVEEGTRRGEGTSTMPSRNIEVGVDAAPEGDLAEVPPADTAGGSASEGSASEMVPPLNPVVLPGDHRAVQPGNETKQAFVPEVDVNKVLNGPHHYSDFSTREMGYYQTASSDNMAITIGAGVNVMAVAPEFWSGGRYYNSKQNTPSHYAPFVSPHVNLVLAYWWDYSDKLSFWPYARMEVNAMGWRADFDSIYGMPDGFTYGIALKRIRLGLELGVDAEWVVGHRLGLIAGIGVGSYLGISQKYRGEQYHVATGLLMPGEANEWTRYDEDGMLSGVYCITGNVGLRRYFKGGNYLQLGLTYRTCSFELGSDETLYMPYSIYCRGYRERTLGLTLQYGILF